MPRDSGLVDKPHESDTLHLLVLVLHSLLAQILAPQTRFLSHGHERGNEGVGDEEGRNGCNKGNGKIHYVLRVSTDRELHGTPFCHRE